MTLTPSAQAISLCNFPCVANSFACANFVAISTLECLFLLGIAACIRPSLRCCPKSFIAPLVLQHGFPCRTLQPFIALEIYPRDGGGVWVPGLEWWALVGQNRGGGARGAPWRAMWIGLTESRGAGGTDQA